MHRKSMSGRPGSSIPRPNSGLGHNNSPSHGLSTTRSANEQYLFPILKPQAIVSCMSDLNVPCAEEDLARPTPQKMMVVYEAFMDVAKGPINDDLYLEDIQDMIQKSDVQISEPAEMVIDAGRFFLFNEQLADVMDDVGVPDFTTKDVTKPDADRVKRVISALINFAKFRGENQGRFLQTMSETDDLTFQLEELETEAEQMLQDLEMIKQQRHAEEPRVEEYKAENQQLAMEMEEYKRREVQTTRQKDEVTRERLALTEQNRELNGAIERLTKDINELQAKRVEVPETLDQDLVQIPEAIQLLLADIERARNELVAQSSVTAPLVTMPKELSTVVDMLNNVLRLQEQSLNDNLELESRKSAIENRSLTAATIRPRMETVDRLIRNNEEKFKILRENQVLKRAQIEMENEEDDKSYKTKNERRLECYGVEEEKQKRQTDILQREEKSAQESTTLMEQLKLQFQGYTAEMQRAMRQT
ncbi:kinetochore-associated Ndc80 complex subunit nuf2 [Mortierella alpina]|nr:kinetochore-associated Ndc80 complex subunit nuf2 [Mortierella alpina]